MNMENESDAWKKIADQNKTKEKEKTQNETELTGKWVSTKYLVLSKTCKHMAYSKIDWNMSRTVLCNNVKVLYFCATFQFTTRC